MRPAVGPARIPLFRPPLCRAGTETSAGRITQAQADQMKADAKERADDIVNGKAPLGRARRHPGGFRGPGEFGFPPVPPPPGDTTTTVTN